MWDIGGYCETVKYSTSAPSYDGAALFIELTIAVGSERSREPLASWRLCENVYGVGTSG